MRYINHPHLSVTKNKFLKSAVKVLQFSFLNYKDTEGITAQVYAVFHLYWEIWIFKFPVRNLLQLEKIRRSYQPWSKKSKTPEQ